MTEIIGDVIGLAIIVLCAIGWCLPYDAWFVGRRGR